MQVCGSEFSIGIEGQDERIALWDIEHAIQGIVLFL